VSKLAKDDPPKRLGGRELGEIDSVKKVSILIDELSDTRPRQDAIVKKKM
jgi:hypothetical protein